MPKSNAWAKTALKICACMPYDMESRQSAFGLRNWFHDVLQRTYLVQSSEALLFVNSCQDVKSSSGSFCEACLPFFFCLLELRLQADLGEDVWEGDLVRMPCPVSLSFHVKYD